MSGNLGAEGCDDVSLPHHPPVPPLLPAPIYAAAVAPVDAGSEYVMGCMGGYAAGNVLGCAPGYASGG